MKTRVFSAKQLTLEKRTNHRTEKKHAMGRKPVGPTGAFRGRELTLGQGPVGGGQTGLAWPARMQDAAQARAVDEGAVNGEPWW